MMQLGREIVGAAYDAVYAALRHSPTLQRIWREHALGDDYPQGFEHLSFVTAGELRRMAGALNIRPGEVLMDLGCGAGGPALWMVRECQVRCVGIDASSIGLERAPHRAKHLGLAQMITLAVGHFDRLALGTEAADAVMSVDALQYAPDKDAAFAECARVLRTGGRLVFTAFEIDGDRATAFPVFGADPVDDFRPVLQRAGFSIDAYEETIGWQDRMTSTYRAVLDARSVLTQEMGAAAAAALFFEAAVALERQIFRRRVFVASTRSANGGSHRCVNQ